MADRDRKMPLCLRFSIVFEVPLLLKYLIKLTLPLMQDFLWLGIKIAIIPGTFYAKSFRVSWLSFYMILMAKSCQNAK